MPNGGSDCCGTCWFNRRNRNHHQYLQYRDVRIEPYCEIRNLPLEDPFYTYCANHPYRRPQRDRMPIGPVYEGMDRRILHPSPDTPEIRQHLLDIVADTLDHRVVGGYLLGFSLLDVVFGQLLEWGDERLLPLVESYLDDEDEEVRSGAKSAHAGLTKRTSKR